MGGPHLLRCRFEVASMRRWSSSFIAGLICSLRCACIQAVVLSFLFLRIKRGSLSSLESDNNIYIVI